MLQAPQRKIGRRLQPKNRSSMHREWTGSSQIGLNWLRQTTKNIQSTPDEKPDLRVLRREFTGVSHFKADSTDEFHGKTGWKSTRIAGLAWKSRHFVNRLLALTAFTFVLKDLRFLPWKREFSINLSQHGTRCRSLARPSQKVPVQGLRETHRCDWNQFSSAFPVKNASNTHFFRGIW
jgi:hypothetical protein